jgi:hypothetical protein
MLISGFTRIFGIGCFGPSGSAGNDFPGRKYKSMAGAFAELPGRASFARNTLQ